MNINPQTKERLQFLARVVTRECAHLDKTTQRLFVTPLTLERLQTIDADDELSERVEAFASRFSRLQDTLGDKLLPLLLVVLGEKPSTAIDNLDKAEKLGWLNSSDEWMTIRQLRNQMVHDYIEDITILITECPANSTASRTHAIKNHPKPASRITKKKYPAIKFFHC